MNSKPLASRWRFPSSRSPPLPKAPRRRTPIRRPPATLVPRRARSIAPLVRAIAEVLRQRRAGQGCRCAPAWTPTRRSFRTPARPPGPSGQPPEPAAAAKTDQIASHTIGLSARAGAGNHLLRRCRVHPDADKTLQRLERRLAPSRRVLSRVQGRIDGGAGPAGCV